MGLSESFLVAKSESADLGVKSEALGEHDGWQYMRLWDTDGVDPETAARTVADARGLPALAAFVADSDIAAVFFASPSGISGSLAINAINPSNYTPSYYNEDEGATHTQQWIDRDEHHAAAELLAAWAAQNAPRQPSASEIVAALAELEDEELSAKLGHRRILFAEDGLQVIFEDLLGLASLDDAVFMAGDL